ncbi:MAG: response regulator transcription factor [Opitutaceae bacterium]|nr:response regulator transcription factor [Opitutaceae bacterium]
MTRILLADDHAMLRAGLKGILAEEIAGAIFGEAGNAADTLALVRREPWDVLVLDVNMPGRNGFEVLAEVAGDHPDLSVLVLSSTEESQIGLRAIKAGAAGFLNKQAAPERLVEAVKTLLGGGRFITPALAARLAAEFQRTGSRLAHELLSERELQVLQLTLRGRSVKEIAVELSLSAKTISTFRGRLFAKLGVRNDVELARYAQEHGLGGGP